MGSNEPSLVPEWLRSNGHGNNGASASVNSHSDAPLLSNSGRNRSSRTNIETGGPRLILERYSSISSRRIFNNNSSSKNPYSNFSRSHRDGEREKVKLGHGDIREHDNSEPMVEPLRRTRSMVSRNQSNLLPRRVTLDPKNIETNNSSPRNGLVTGDTAVGSMQKGFFEKDFPSLGADEKQVPNVARVGSPRLPIGSSAFSEGWSALAEVSIVTGSNNGPQSIHQPLSTSVPSNSISGGANAVSAALKPVAMTSNAFSGVHKTSGALAPSSTTNMAEALVQSPPNTLQLSVEIQRLEHMTIKKVRQLIPMTPAMPKVKSSSDKLKQKLNARAGEISAANNAGQKMSSSLNYTGQSPRSRPDTYDASKQSHGSKLFVLKPTWENTASSNSEDVSNHENGVGIGQTINFHVAPLVSSGPVKSTPNSKGSSMERKSAISSLTLASVVEKRPISSAQSRSDFFNSVRKKTLSTTAGPSETDSSMQSPSEQKYCDMLKVITPSSSHGTENGNSVNMEDVQKSLKEEKRVDEKYDTPDEKDAEFLRSLGWDENYKEGGLTEKEINDFYQVVEKLKLSVPLPPGVQSAFSMLKEHLQD